MNKSENKIITNKSKLSTPILYVMIAVASGFLEVILVLKQMF